MARELKMIELKKQIEYLKKHGRAGGVERIEGKFKLSQNRPADVAGVIDALDQRGVGRNCGKHTD